MWPTSDRTSPKHDCTDPHRDCFLKATYEILRSLRRERLWRCVNVLLSCCHANTVFLFLMFSLLLFSFLVLPSVIICTSCWFSLFPPWLVCHVSRIGSVSGFYSSVFLPPTSLCFISPPFSVGFHRFPLPIVASSHIAASVPPFPCS